MSKILLVESDSLTAYVRCVPLEEAGLSVRHTQSGREALGLLGKADFSVVLVEMGLSDIPPLRLLEMIRSRYKSVAVALIGDDSDEKLTLALELGARDYISRNAPASFLCRRVENLVLSSLNTSDRVDARDTSFMPMYLEISRDAVCPRCQSLIERTAESCHRCSVDMPIEGWMPTSASDFPDLGQTIGRYHLEQGLGVGSVGTVYRAVDRLLALQVAIKIIELDVGLRDRITDIAHEVRATASIKGPSVLQVFEVTLTEENQLAVIMELAHGTSLRHLIAATGPSSLLHSLEIIRQTGEGLRSAHTVGIIHRDVKPENVVIHVPTLPQRQRSAAGRGLHQVRSLEVKVVDFGIAFLVDSKKAKEELFFGTPAFASPEQIARPNSIDARTDLYSTGALLYYMVTGRTPFAGKTARDILRQHISAPRPIVNVRDTNFPEPVVRHLNRIVAKAMAKKPDDRYRDMTSFIRAIDELGDRVLEHRLNKARS